MASIKVNALTLGKYMIIKGKGGATRRGGGGRGHNTPRADEAQGEGV